MNRQKSSAQEKNIQKLEFSPIYLNFTNEKSWKRDLNRKFIININSEEEFKY